MPDAVIPVLFWALVAVLVSPLVVGLVANLRRSWRLVASGEWRVASGRANSKFRTPNSELRTLRGS